MNLTEAREEIDAGTVQATVSGYLGGRANEEDCATTIGSGRGRHYAAAVIATPDSRVWVAWSEEDQGRVRVVLRRSNSRVTRFGERIVLRGPNATTRVFALDGSSQAKRLDLVATAASSEGSGSRPFHTQVLPPLELSATPRRLRGGEAAKVRLKVTDVGVPVARASVSAGGEQATTGRDGRATIALSGPRNGGKITASSTKENYLRDRVKLTVTRAR